MNSLEMKINVLLSQTTKARVFAAMVALSGVYSVVPTFASDERRKQAQRAQLLHTKLLTTVRNPYIVRQSLQDLLDDIEDEYPVPMEMEIGWITEHQGTIPDFVNNEIPKYLQQKAE